MLTSEWICWICCNCDAKCGMGLLALLNCWNGKGVWGEEEDGKGGGERCKEPI